MALLEPSSTTKKKSRGGSTRSRSSSAPVSTLPSPESLQKISQLEKRIEELEAKDHGSTAEIDRLKAELVKLAHPVNVNPAEPSNGKESTHDQPERKSFWGF